MADKLVAITDWLVPMMDNLVIMVNRKAAMAVKGQKKMTLP